MYDIFVESGMYGPATLRQILDCTHYKRAIYALICLFLALYILLFESFLEANLHVRGTCVDTVETFEEAITCKDKKNIKAKHAC